MKNKAIQFLIIFLIHEQPVQAKHVTIPIKPTCETQVPAPGFGKGTKDLEYHNRLSPNRP